MTDDGDLEGLDPYDVFDQEAARLHAFLAGLGDDAWGAPTRCEGWTVRDMLGHLRAAEDYHQACAKGGVADFLGALVERGATDVATFNALGIADYADVPAGELIEAWSEVDADTRARFRAADGHDVDTSVGQYPGRWQAFHLASELATHADDIGVPVPAGEAGDRLSWRTAFSRFALKESKPGAMVSSSDGRTHVRVDDVEGDLSDAAFVELVMGRDPVGEDVSPELRAALDTSP